MSTRYHKLKIPERCLRETTKELYCFEFSNGYRRNIPISQTHNVAISDGDITMYVADWVIRERHLKRWIVDDTPPLQANYDYVN